MGIFSIYIYCLTLDPSENATLPVETCTMWKTFFGDFSETAYVTNVVESLAPLGLIIVWHCK